jgi:glycosyltransferase involved in cell wall biosynthesis
VIARNEEAVLPAALKSLEQLVDAVVLVDDGSTDATVDIARGFGATVVRRRLDADFAAQRNATAAHISTPWVLHLDADERLPADLAGLLRHVADSTDADIVHFPRLTRVEGRVTGWPDYVGRLHRPWLRYRGRLHERVAGWRRTVHLPLSGPFLAHDKDWARQHRASLLYESIEPHLDAGTVAWVHQELARLQDGDGQYP